MNVLQMVTRPAVDGCETPNRCQHQQRLGDHGGVVGTADGSAALAERGDVVPRSLLGAPSLFDMLRRVRTAEEPFDGSGNLETTTQIAQIMPLLHISGAVGAPQRQIRCSLEHGTLPIQRRSFCAGHKDQGNSSRPSAQALSQYRIVNRQGRASRRSARAAGGAAAIDALSAAWPPHAHRRSW